ncbi:MAG: fused MFS/spermidine synthase [Novosphingobium sp.]|nr:fused MFS/spermidine synthase [Novosphingobium sp.]
MAGVPRVTGAGSGRGGARRPLFVGTIFTGSFLLFLVQPMVARMVLPMLGGAPAVWNSAMLVYQALLLAGYAYAHRLARLPLRRQVRVHLALLAFAALTLPVTLVTLPPARPGWEAVWVPALFALSVGPVFLLVSAQAPLMQRWFAADPRAGEPWALYAASNLGSFAGLMAYPLLAEPLLPLTGQSWAWSAGYALLFVLVAVAAWSRWRLHDVTVAARADDERGESGDPAIGWRRIALWLGLSAVPSGLMLSTTTHLTTDIFAMPLLWVIPLGLYLLSMVAAFADRRAPARAITALAPLVMLAGGGMAMVSRHSTTLAQVAVTVVLLFVVCVALHARLYESRPVPSQLTRFYLVMATGGALGGVFTALVAPLVFDWTWEHPLLVFMAAMLLPFPVLLDWRRMRGLDAGMARFAAIVVFLVAALLCWFLLDVAADVEPGPQRWVLTGAIAVLGLALLPWRWAWLMVLLGVMLAQGGVETIQASWDGLRKRSYFGVYTVRDYPSSDLRVLAHGTTLHGEQSTDPALRLVPVSYYGPGSGVGIAFANAGQLVGQNARVGVLGLGAGTLACFARPGQQWVFFEIDPVVLQYSRDRTFTYLQDCAPDAKVVIGDARLELARMPDASLDLLAMDAFSSDAIPMHLITDEAFGEYLRVLSPDGILLVHISNRFIELEPIVAAEAKQRGLAAAIRDDAPPPTGLLTPSSWVALARDPARLEDLRRLAPAMEWKALQPPAPRPWTDDRASILPYIRWHNILGKP